MLGKWMRGARKKPGASETFEQYVTSTPSPQNAIDMIPGWSSAFPESMGLKAGAIHFHSDPRIFWALEQFGSVLDKDVLELGPLDGGHSYLLERAGARVEAIEANQIAFMRCLVAKEIYGMTRARFLLGDFVKWLGATDKTYDLVVASGILYHMKDPLDLIEKIAARAGAVFYWTHVMSDEAMPVGDPRRMVFANEPEIHSFHGVDVRAYRRTYLNANTQTSFCGGIEDEHRWLEKDDLIAALAAVGYDDIRTTGFEPTHQFGPALSVLARKTK